MAKAGATARHRQKMRLGFVAGHSLEATAYVI
jgi:hypothetical protein